jgi:hypothetical protein
LLLLAISSCKQNQSQLLVSWNNLADQFLHRIELFENLAKTKSIDKTYLDSLKNLKFQLKERLNQTEPFDTLFIRDIKILNKRVISFFPVPLMPSKNDSLMSPSEFQDIQTSLESMENRISFARKEYNAVCYKIDRKDLVY